MSDLRSTGEVEVHRRPQYLLVPEVPALILISYLSLLTLGLLDNIRGPYFYEVLTELGVSNAVGSWFFATTSLFAFIGSLASDRLVHARGSLWSLAAASFGLGFGFLAVALAPTLTPLLLACVIFGLSFGVLNVTQNLLVVESAPAHLRRRYLNGLHSMYGVAALLAPVAASGFRWMGLDWRQAFLVLAVWPLVLGWAAFLRHGGPRVAQAQRTRAIRMDSGDWRRCFVFALILCGYLWAELSISTRLVVWLRTERAFSPDQANFYLAGFFLALLSGRAYFSFRHVAVRNERVLLVSSALGAILFALGLYLHPALLFVAGLAMSPFFPVTMDQIPRLFGEKSHQAMGFVIGFGSLSLVIMHVLIGWISDQAGITTALTMCAVTLACVSLAMVGPALRAAETK